MCFRFRGFVVIVRVRVRDYIIPMKAITKHRNTSVCLCVYVK